MIPSLTNDEVPPRYNDFMGYETLIPRAARGINDLRPTKFGKLLLFLAERRQEIAKELGHGATDKNSQGKIGRTDEYGKLRFEGSVLMVESLKRDDSPQDWQSQKDKVFAEYDKLLDVNFGENFSFNNDCYYVSAKKHPNETNKLYTTETGEYCLFINFSPKKPDGMTVPVQEYSNPTIRHNVYVKFDKNTKKIKAQKCDIFYTNLNKYDQIGDFDIANHYLETMLNWKEEDGLAEFMKRAAKLAYEMIVLLPTSLGSAGITEWMLRAVAFHKGIILGELNQTNGISWDFKALMTPNIDDYANWFATNAFYDVKLVKDLDQDLNIQPNSPHTKRLCNAREHEDLFISNHNRNPPSTSKTRPVK